ncbi:MAG TPA: class I SAM-dependent methyltransferase [Verrucomicrobiales bacterium]|nr:class I SAM-dependent methyltransferase [Verrucomicrobiales bacterium]
MPIDRMAIQAFRPVLITRNTCRICGSRSLTPVVSLGDQFIGGVLASEDGSALIKRKVPLDLVRCDPSVDENACGLVQMRHSVPPKVLYHRYYYESGINQSMIDNLTGITQLVEETVKLKAKDIVLDIGCNDGTLLSSYQTQGLRHIGIDPSDVALKARAKGFEVVNDFFTARAFKSVHATEKARVVTSISMFYDLENPHAFVQDIADVLATDGIWILEQSYLPAMLDINSFDTICHEHLEYYSLAVLERLFGDHGLEVIDVHLNDVNGGSFRLVVAHAGQVKPSAEAAVRVQDLRIREFEMAIDSDAPYAVFRDNIERIRTDLNAFLKKAKSEGKLVHGYGASTKGSTTLQFCNVTPDLVPAIADRNPVKWGSYTIGTQIKIISEDESRAAKPDYYLVLPWHFMPEFLKREQDFLARGGKFVVPMPQVHLVG